MRELGVNGSHPRPSPDAPGDADAPWLVTEFALASIPRNERRAMELVGEAAQELGLTPPRLERLKTAVSEATMNAIEHGNRFRPELLVTIRVLASPDDLVVTITDHGSGSIRPAGAAPDLQAKLEGRQPARGWGLFLIQNMVDELRVTTGDDYHTVELVMHRKGADNAGAPT
jgi:anti-sigma regulatory factor (Ser/Thr protein kinase)